VAPASTHRLADQRHLWGRIGHGPRRAVALGQRHLEEAAGNRDQRRLVRVVVHGAILAREASPLTSPDEAERLNTRLVDGLRRDGAILDSRIEAAFRTVRRHWFLPEAALADVYRDQALVTHRDEHGVPISSSSQPALMALMLEQLSVQPGMAVLEIGAGTGYNAALLGHLVGPDGTVLTIDVDPAVTGPATRHLAAAGASNVKVLTTDGWALETGDRFDRIEVTVGVWDLSPAWVAALEAGGLLVVPIWLRAGQQASVAFRKVHGRLEGVTVEPCGFMRMRGPGAGAPTYRRLGPWTVTLDDAGTERLEVLGVLLDAPSSVHRIPPPERGWFTTIALREPGAVNLFAEGPGGPVVRSGILQLSPPGLAVVETNPPAADVIRACGDDEPLRRLLDLLDRSPAIDPATLAISAVPAGMDVEDAGALATLVRPNFTLVVRVSS
jgi:protein-L-isoaspartate(D-aspartate) O-methyltransferase